jgi:transcriptional regulator with XRE-family HTH domain
LEKINKPNNLLRSQREQRGWSQEKLAEEVGTTHVNISRWETGVTSPSPHYRSKLCEIFEKNASELGLLGEGGKEPEERSSTPASPSLVSHVAANALWPPSIPREQYYPLPGRERDLAQLSAALQDPQGSLVVTIDGLGGLGKTAMAVELARRLLQEKRFAGVVGESAKQELFTGRKIVQVNEAILDVDLLLDAIARQLGRWEVRTFQREEKCAILRQCLQQTPYLILVDNLETAENADALVFALQSLLGVSRAVVTSRKQVSTDFVHSHSLKGLTQEDSLFFLQKEVEQHGSEQLKHVSEAKLVEIYMVTGGAPLALKLVIAQTKFLDLDVVLRRLRNAGSKLYSFIYQQSWEQLSPIAQRVLIYIGQTVVTTVGWEELVIVGEEIAESEEQLLEAIDELVAYSLLDVSSLDHQVRYGAHQLTRQFVKSDLPQLWKEQKLL